jgi:hypothetical protein
MCLGCLFAGLAATFPRVALLIMWIFTDWVNIAFDNWIVPLLGLIFLPFATLMYVFVDLSSVGHHIGWAGWLLVVIAGLFDLMHWGQTAANRSNGMALYGQYAPGHS